MTEQSSLEARRRLIDNDIPYDSKQYEIFLEQLKTERNSDEEILRKFSEEYHSKDNLFSEMNLNFKKRKGKLQNCINKIEQDKEKLEKEISSLKMPTGHKNFINLKMKEDVLHYKMIFLTMAKDELEREELFKNKAMKVIMAECANHGLQAEDS